MAKSFSAELQAKASARQATPIELIDVYMGAQNEVDANTLFFNDSNENVNFWPFRDMTMKQSYIALGIKRQGVQAHMQGQLDSVEVTLDNVSRTFSTLFAQQEFRGKRIVIRRVYADHLDVSGDNILLFDGVLDSPDASVDEGVRIELKPSVQDSLNYRIPRELFGPTCNNRFTDECCANVHGPKTAAQLLQERTGLTIDSVASQTEFVDAALTAETTGDYDPAVVKITAGNAANVGERRSARVSGDTVKLDHPFPEDIEAGDEYSLQRDCLKDFTRDCKNRFGNQTNFRGFRTLPKNIVQK